MPKLALPRTRTCTAIVVLFVGAVLWFLFAHLVSDNGARAWKPEEELDEADQHLLDVANGQAGIPNNPLLLQMEPESGVNIFEHFRQNATCTVDSRHLYAPSGQAFCNSTTELLRSMAEGKRDYQDGPFHPAACEMQWYSTQQACDILSRFTNVWMIGDSLIRHIASALHIYLREDLIDGAFRPWAAHEQQQIFQRTKEDAIREGKEPPEEPTFDCQCDRAFANGACLFYEAWSSADVRLHAPAAMKCDPSLTAGIELVVANNYPMEKGTLNRVRQTIADTRPPGAGSGNFNVPAKPHAIIMGGGLWYDLELGLFEEWISSIQQAITLTLDDEYGTFDTPKFPMLAITPSAGGPLKPHKYVDKQNNKRIKAFEKGFAAWLVERHARGLTGTNIHHLGTYNATILNTSPDGTHSGLKADLLKAMMVLNWLDLVSR